ncbi:MAG: hypothetical protein ABIQ97_04570 [Lysobacteraceae bacterium]
MNVKLLVAAGILVGLVAASGCASMRKDNDTRSLATKTHTRDVDAAYVSEVERRARHSNAQVIWVNPPEH